MSIVRVLAVDPEPRKGAYSDVLVYQVPENSREIELLEQLFAIHGVQYVIMTQPRKGNGHGNAIESKT